jgi:hypothetical protein
MEALKTQGLNRIVKLYGNLLTTEEKRTFNNNYNVFVNL